MYTIIKRFYGEEIYGNQTKNYATKQDAIDAGNSWQNDCTVRAELRKARNFEVIKN